MTVAGISDRPFLHPPHKIALLPLKICERTVVNLSSQLGSLTLNGDPAWRFAPFKLLGLCASKAAVNMLTVQLAFELRDTPIKVNSAHPGFIATDSTQHQGDQTAEEGAVEPVRLALLSDNEPTGGVFSQEGELPW